MEKYELRTGGRMETTNCVHSFYALELRPFHTKNHVVDELRHIDLKDW